MFGYTQKSPSPAAERIAQLERDVAKLRDQAVEDQFRRQAELAASLFRKQPEPCPCLELKPAVVFKVKRRAPNYGRFSSWEDLGHTADLNTAMLYKDGSPSRVWVEVHRGFVDKNGHLYDADRRRLDCVPAEYRP